MAQIPYPTIISLRFDGLVLHLRSGDLMIKQKYQIETSSIFYLAYYVIKYIELVCGMERMDILRAEMEKENSALEQAKQLQNGATPATKK